MTPKEETEQFAHRFRDLVHETFVLGERAGKAGFGAGILHLEQVKKMMELWEEMLKFMRRQVEDAKPKKPTDTVSVPPKTEKPK